MANRPRTRKRVYAVRRARDGSAFQKCDECGVSVAVALADMHECGDNRKEVKRFKGICSNPNVLRQNSFNDQPRSPFCLFMESLVKSCEDRDSFDLYREGFETWKNMSDTEREPYVSQAERVNSAYFRCLIEEAKSYFKVDDEADSANVGRFDKLYNHLRECEPSGHSGSHWRIGFKTSNTHQDMAESWIIESSEESGFLFDLLPELSD